MSRGPVIVSMLVAALVATPVGAQERWLRGNVHVHSDASDGTAPVDTVVAWYAAHGYHFVAVTDHDLQVVTSELRAAFDREGAFLVMRGVEVTDRVDGRPVHLNGLGVREAVGPQGGSTAADAIRRNAAAIERVGGLAVLNHPNGLLPVALTAEEIAAGGVTLFEVCCSDWRGGSGRPSTEQLWDAVLTGGGRLYGVAADDAHDFAPSARQAGTSWVTVRAASLDEGAILAALARGDFYATTGVVLADVRTEGDTLCVVLAEDDYGYRTRFLGPGGRELHVDARDETCFERPTDATYLRARVERSDGALAWVQPIFRGDAR